MFRNLTLKIKINFIGKNGIYVCVCSIRSFTQTAVNSFNFFLNSWSLTLIKEKIRLLNELLTNLN